MSGYSDTAQRLLKKVGIVGGTPRILNMDTGVYSIGYTKINVMATTAFSRTKTHKAWFLGDTDITDGTRILDRVDNKKYLVMSLKAEFIDESVCYYDGTLFFVNATCSISRLGTTLDEFGRVTATGFTVSAADIWTMVNPIVMDVIEQPDKILDKNKIKLAMQASVDIRENDRVTTNAGEQFKVLAYSRSEIEGLVMVYVESDNR